MYTVILRGSELIGIHPSYGVDFAIDGLTYVTSYDEIPDLNQYYWDFISNTFVSSANSRSITKLAFRRRFATTERIQIDNFNYSFETYSYLTDAQKAEIRSGLEDYNIAIDINLDDPGVTQLLSLYAMFGLLEAHRIQEIIS